MTVSNIGLASVVSDPFRKTATSIMKEVIGSDTKLIHRSCKHKDKIQDSLHGFQIESDQKFKLEKSSEHMQFLDKLIEACEIELVSWAGLSPANDESANKKKSVRISKAGQYLKPLLVQCALASIKDKTSYFGIKYLRIRKRRGHKKAIIAIARMMLVCIYHMIKTGNDFKPSDYQSLMNPKARQDTTLTVENTLAFLEQAGIDISSIKVSSDNSSQQFLVY